MAPIPYWPPSVIIRITTLPCSVTEPWALSAALFSGTMTGNTSTLTIFIPFSFNMGTSRVNPLNSGLFASSRFLIFEKAEKKVCLKSIWYFGFYQEILLMKLKLFPQLPSSSLP
jgi:hypothetical protein